jgi:hypothetical protein
MSFRGFAALTAFNLFLGMPIRAEDASTVMAPQPQISLTQGQSGTWKTDWEGITGRTYLIQWTEDLVNWNYLPLTTAGAGSKNYGFKSSTEKFFVRLDYSDETPDLGKTTDWQPPLLLVRGEWTVLAKDKSGAPAAGVELAFFRWPTNSPKPQSPSSFKGITASNGRYTFNPTLLTSGERMEVRMAGSPNQRVYLPWSESRQSSDLTITPGGNGLEHTKIDGILAGGGTGRNPVTSDLPNDEDPSGEEGEPVYRLIDYLTTNYNSEGFGKKESPFGHHLVKEEVFSIGSVDSRIIETPVDFSNWDEPFILGSARIDSDENLEPSTYEAELSVSLENPNSIIKVQRNIFTTVVEHYEEDVWPIPNPVYPPIQIQLRDGIANQHDLGMGNFSFSLAECPFGPEGKYLGALSGVEYDRQLILGPVPAHVPEAVMAGEKFYFTQWDSPSDPAAASEFNKVLLGAELPLGSCSIASFFSDPFDPYLVGPPPPNRLFPTKIIWSATVNAGSPVVVSIDTVPPSANPSLETDLPKMMLEFSNPGEDIIDSDFSVTVTARLKVADSETPGPNGQYTYHFVEHDLGSFTTDFKYVPRAKEKSQERELSGANGDAPESAGFNGGQRFKTLERERKIGVTGQPAPDSPTFVDALTGRFHHSERDFSLTVPGSDLSLAVTLHDNI